MTRAKRSVPSSRRQCHSADLASLWTIASAVCRDKQPVLDCRQLLATLGVGSDQHQQALPLMFEPRRGIMASGLALLEGATASDGRRVEYLAVDPCKAGAAAEAGADLVQGPEPGRRSRAHSW
jgi:hypothetical protein